MGGPSADPPVTGLGGSPLGSGAQQRGLCCGASCDEGSTGRTLPIEPIAAIEERCAALLVLHASLASKHLAVVSRRLADVATIFLPISFLAGFWGQNFDVLTGSIEKG